MAKAGIFISFEGMEGAGKSTQTQLLVGRLREEGYQVIGTREPGGTRIGEQIRRITHDPENVDLTAGAEAYLMAAARAQHVEEIIGPALAEGKIVVCDRFIDSSLAYQGYGRNLGFKTVWRLNGLALSAIKRKSVALYKKRFLPDLTLLLNIAFAEGIRRRNKTAKIDRLDLQQQEFYKRVETGYNELAARNKQRIVKIDANATIEAVFEKVWGSVRQKLN